jgi:hypothetical protein
METSPIATHLNAMGVVNQRSEVRGVITLAH